MPVNARIAMAARHAKHLGWLAGKQTQRALDKTWFAAITAIGPHYAALRPYEFDAGRYRRSFVVREAPVDTAESHFPRHVFVAWTGDNALTPNRARNIDVLRDRIGLPVHLITPRTLPEWTVPSHPIHPAYENLSLVHRSDYLRAYLLHHHGGAYADLKAPATSWARAFDRMRGDEDAWITSYASTRAEWAAKAKGRLGQDLLLHHQRLLGNGAMMARSHTPFTAEWLREVERRMDYYAPQADEFPGGIRGDVTGYPVSWNHLLAQVFDPLTLKYLKHSRQDDDLLLDFVRYQ